MVSKKIGDEYVDLDKSGAIEYYEKNDFEDSNLIGTTDETGKEIFDINTYKATWLDLDTNKIHGNNIQTTVYTDGTKRVQEISRDNTNWSTIESYKVVDENLKAQKLAEYNNISNNYDLNNRQKIKELKSYFYSYYKQKFDRALYAGLAHELGSVEPIDLNGYPSYKAVIQEYNNDKVLCGDGGIDYRTKQDLRNLASNYYNEKIGKLVCLSQVSHNSQTLINSCKNIANELNADSYLDNDIRQPLKEDLQSLINKG